MTAFWREKPDAEPVKMTPMGWLRVVLRLIPAMIVLLAGVVATLILRLPERLIAGQARPLTSGITTWVCRSLLLIIGIRLTLKGDVMNRGGAVVANHSSWLDILVLNARKRIYFVSKAEVETWPGIGFLARLTGTVFITRRSRDAARQKNLFQDRLSLGHRLLFFPEGTSTDGLRVVSFKSTLFQAFFAPELGEEMAIQPVTARFIAPPDASADFYGWWGDMELAPHLLKVLAHPKRGAVEIICHDPLFVRDFSDRKALAKACEAAVGSVFEG